MSPEQLCSTKGLDPRSDIWALGVVMYELLVGCVPFDGESFTEICARILHAPAPRIDDVRVDVPKGVADVVARCLAKDRNNRFRSVKELAAALAPFAKARNDRSRTTARTKRVFPQPSAMRMVAAVLGAASLSGLLSIALQEEGTLPTREGHRAEVVTVRSAFIVTSADSAPSRTLDVLVDARPPAATRPIVRSARVTEPDLGY